jgi:hypothetical protein
MQTKMKTLIQRIGVALSTFLLVANTGYAETKKADMTVRATVINGCSINSSSVTMSLGATNQAQISCSTGSSQPTVYNMPIQLISYEVNSYIELDQLVVVTMIYF